MSFMHIFLSYQGVRLDKLEAGSDGRIATVILENGSTVEADTV